VNCERQLPEGFQLLPATAADADAIYESIAACEHHETARRRSTDDVTVGFETPRARPRSTRSWCSTGRTLRLGREPIGRAPRPRAPHAPKIEASAQRSSRASKRAPERGRSRVSQRRPTSTPARGALPHSGYELSTSASSGMSSPQPGRPEPRSRSGSYERSDARLVHERASTTPLRMAGRKPEPLRGPGPWRCSRIRRSSAVSPLGLGISGSSPSARGALMDYSEEGGSNRCDQGDPPTAGHRTGAAPERVRRLLRRGRRMAGVSADS
jgi:hypothetical protein